MSTKTREEVLAQLRRQYGKAHGFAKTTLLDQTVRLLGYHRKAAIRALQSPSSAPARPPGAAAGRGRPKEYEATALQPPLRTIYHHNDNAHVEQKNWTHVRQWFGYERYDHEPVVELINTLTQGALGQLQNFFLPTLKLEAKERDAKGRLQRRYGAAQTPWARVLAHETVSAEKKQELQALKAKLNPFALQREVERQLKRIFKQRSRSRPRR